MDINDDQKATITEWVRQGEDLSTIQSRLKDELDITLTYVDTRFLLADLELELSDETEEEQAVTTGIEENHRENTGEENRSTAEVVAGDNPPPVEQDTGSESTVSVTVDSLTRTNAAISGKVTFSDGECAAWHIDRAGQPRLDPVKEDYRPSEEDIAKLLAELQKLLR
jgi:hypothetical protein